MTVAQLSSANRIVYDKKLYVCPTKKFLWNSPYIVCHVIEYASE